MSNSVFMCPGALEGLCAYHELTGDPVLGKVEAIGFLQGHTRAQRHRLRTRAEVDQPHQQRVAVLAALDRGDVDTFALHTQQRPASGQCPSAAGLVPSTPASTTSPP